MTNANWMLETIVPKSDQLNADDLIGGPITVTIEQVIRRESADQPVEIRIAGHRPYKPCKSMRRVLCAAWPVSPDEYVGRRMTLVNDPSVTWAGKAVGGIRIQALSHIEQPLTMAITVTRGNRKPVTVYPIAIQQPSFLDKWRGEFGGASSDVMNAAKAIAAAYTAKDLAALEVAAGMVEALPSPCSDETEKHFLALIAFADSVKSELSV